MIARFGRVRQSRTYTKKPKPLHSSYTADLRAK